MKNQSLEVFIASPNYLSQSDILRHLAAFMDVNLDTWLQENPLKLVAYDRDFSDLQFDMVEKIQMKKLTTPTQAYKIRVDVIIEEIQSKEKEKA